MTRLTLHPPLEIGPRLMPAVSIAPGTDHAGRVSLSPDDWEWYVDLADGTTVSGGDFRPGAPVAGDDVNTYLRHAMAAFVGFLSAFAESVEYERRTGTEGDCYDLFPAELREWAYLNSDELSILSYDLEYDDDDE